MNATPEARIKPALDHASREPGLGFDPAEVLRLGHRAVRRRRVVGIGATAAVAVAAIAVAGQLGGQPNPLTPTGNGSRPTVTQSVASSRATLDLGGTTYVVRYIVTGGDEDRLEYGQLGVDGLAGSSVSSRGDGMTYGGTDAGKAVIGVVPAGTTSVSGFVLPARGTTRSVTAPLAGTRYDAFAIAIDGPGTVADLRSIEWEDAEGRAHTTAASDFQSAVFTVPSTGDAMQVWADAATRAWGARMPGTTTEAPEPYAGKPGLMYVGGRLGGHEGGPEPTAPLPMPEGKAWWVAYGMLPAGASQVELRLRDAATVVGDIYHQQLEAIGATAFAVELKTGGDGQQGGVVAEVRWVNADGTAGSFRPTS